MPKLLAHLLVSEILRPTCRPWQKKQNRQWQRLYWPRQWRKSSEGVLECWEWQPPAARPAPHYSRRIGWWWCSKLPADWMGPCAGEGETKADGGHSLIKENRPRLRHIRSGMVDSWWLYSQSPVFSYGVFTQISEEKLSCWYRCRKMCTGSL